ncbi:MAG: hypothetical protein ACK5V0_12015, partial [Alphaproteobacteria bacterium]
RLLPDFVAGAGFAGIAVSLIGRNHPGGIVLAALLFEAGVHETARGAPVLCGPLALVQQGQAAVKLKRAMGGRFTSRRGAYGQPPAAQIAELRRYYGAIYPGVGR